MAVRLALQFMEHPSHAFTLCEPWTRLLVETESPGEGGHVIGEEVVLGKGTNELGIITHIEVKQLKADPTAAQCYLDASDWWLHKTPFDAGRLPVSVRAHRSTGSLVSVNNARVTKLHFATDDPATASQEFDLSAVAELLPSVELLDLTCDAPTTLVRCLKHAELLLRCSHAHTLLLQKVDVEVFSLRRDIVPLRQLTKLDVSKTVLTSLAPFAQLPALTVLRCTAARQLRFPSSIADSQTWWPALRELDAEECPGLTSLDFFASAHQLEVIRASKCKRLTDIAAVAGMKYLCKFYASGTGVKDINALRHCAFLEQVQIDFNPQIGDLLPLTRAVNLQELMADESAVTSLAELKHLHALTVLTCNGCEHLTDISEVASLRSLREIYLAQTPISDISSFSGLSCLRTVLLEECDQLRDIGPLAGTTALAVLTLSGTQVHDLTPLQHCTQLEELYMARCTALRDIGPLPHLTRLRALDMSYTAVTDVTPLSHLTGLETLTVQSCPGLWDTSALKQMTRLKQFTAADTKLLDISELSAMKDLEHVVLRGCLELHDVSPLSNCARLTTLDLGGTKIRSLGTLGNLAQLKTLLVNNCSVLAHISTLKTATALEVLDMSHTAVEDVKALRYCVKLREINVSCCRGLRNIAALASLESLEVVDASYSGVEMCGRLINSSHVRKLKLEGTPCVLSDNASRVGLDKLAKLLQQWKP